MNPTTLLYDGYELSKVAEYPDPCGGTFCEPIANDSDPDAALRTYWTVYGHCPAGGVNAIADFDKEADAEALLGHLCLTLDAYLEDRLLRQRNAIWDALSHVLEDPSVEMPAKLRRYAIETLEHVQDESADDPGCRGSGHSGD